MVAILVSGATYSGSGDLTCEAVVLGGQQAGGAAAWGDSTFICPDGVLTLTGNSDVGYTDSAIFVYHTNDVWNHNGGTLRFTSAGLQNVTNYYNAPMSFNNVEIQNSNSSLYEGVKWGSPWNFDTNMDSLTISGAAHFIVENKTTAHFKVSGTVHIPSGNMIRHATPINSGELNAFGALFIGADGTYTAASSGGEVLSITNEIDYWAIDNLGGTFTHNDGTVEITTNTNTIIKGMDGTDATNTLYNLKCNIGSDGYRLQLRPSGSTNTIAGDLTIVQGMFQPETNTQSLTVSGNVIVSGGHLNGYSAARTGVDNYGSLDIKADGEFTATTGVTNITSRNDGGYGWTRNAAGTFNRNGGTVAFTMVDNSVYVIEDEFYNLTIDLPHASYNELRYSDIDGNGLRVNNDFNINDGHFKFDTAADDLMVSGTLLLSGGSTFGITNTPTGDHTIGKLDMYGTYNATTGITTLQGASTGSDRTKILKTRGGSLFNHNSGTVDFSCASGGASTAYIWLDGKATADPFWNTTFNGNTGIHSYTWYKFYAGSSGVITFEGDTAKAHNGSAVFELGNSSTLQLGRTGTSMLFGPFNWFYGSAGNTNLIKSVDTTYPAYISGTSNNKLLGTSGDGYTPTKTTLQDIKLDDLEGDLKGNLHLSGQCEVVEALTVGTGGVLTVASGQRATFGGTMTTAADGLIISGALVEMTGAGNWSEGGYQQYMGRDSASVIWNSTGYYSPNGGYLNTGWKNVFWNAVARVNQDGCFRNSNLIVAGGGLDANNRTIGTAARPTNIKIANGGTISSSTAAFHASNFSNRGGLFASSSAFAFDGAASSGALINAGADSSIDNIFDGGGTVEGWVKLDSGGGGNVGRLVSKDAYFIYFREDSFNNIRLQYTFNGGGAEWYTANDTFTFDNKWHHVAVTYDNSDLANDPSIYLDGKLLPLGTIVRPTGTRSSDVGDVLYVGNNPTGIRTLDGPVGMLRMFSDIRTAEEIRTDMFNQKSDMVDDGALVLMYQFDEGQGTTVTDVSTNSNTGTITMGTSDWATKGTWENNILGTETDVYSGNLYIGQHTTDPTIFTTSYFDIAKRKLIDGSKFGSKSHMGTNTYYIATSGSDYLNYQKLTGAPIGTHSDVTVMADSYFNFDSNARNEQCNILLNEGVVRIVTNSDFYTQDFDNKGTWLRNSTYDGIIHDDGSTPHEYEPIDIMDDQDSFFDKEDLID